jgi:alanine racemase
MIWIPPDDGLDASASGRLTVDLGALTANYRHLAARLAPGAAAGAVVKADAYGLGAARVGRALFDAGCEEFFVAHLYEAVALKAVIEPRGLYVLNGLQPGSEAACAAAGVTPVLNSREQAYRWRDLAAARGHAAPAALQVDTGMTRLGLSRQDIEALIRDPAFFTHVPVALILSHLACADHGERAANRDQLAAFTALAELLPSARRTLANSGGAFLDPAFHGDLVRLGIALYGATPDPRRPNPMAPVVRLDARVIQVHEVAAGQGVGYGLTFSRDSGGQVATIGVGYGDGWPRQLGNVGAAYYRGLRLPIAGRISMDSMTVDVSALRPLGLSLRLGDEVELLGPNQSIEVVAQQAGTIAYEILTRLGRRYHRRYLDPLAERRPS